MNASREWSTLGILLVLIFGITSIGGQACESGGVVLSDNSSITTVTEPSGYIQVEIRPAGIIGKIGQRVWVECTAYSLIDTPVTMASVELVMFDSDDALLRKQVLDVDTQQGGWVRHTIYRIVGDEHSYKLLIVFDVGKILDYPGTRYSEYTATPVPMTITK